MSTDKMAASEVHGERAEKYTTISGFIDARIEVILRRYDCVPDKDIIEELAGGYEKDLLMKTRKIVFKFAIEKVKSCITDLEREALNVDEGPDADGIVADERAAPARSHMDLWELVSRRKKKYFASDLLDLFKFYVGQTDVFPKACVRKCSNNRPGIRTSEIAILEANTVIPQLESQIGKSLCVKDISVDLEDSILDKFTSTPTADSHNEEEEAEDIDEIEEEEVENLEVIEEIDEEEIHETLEEGEIDEQSEESSEEESVCGDVSLIVNESLDAPQPSQCILVSDANGSERSDFERIGSKATAGGHVFPVHKGRSDFTIDKGTDTCTAEDIEMSLRKMREEAAPYIKRSEFERYIGYMNSVLDEYNKRLQEMEGKIDRTCSANPNGDPRMDNKIAEIEMGQAGLCDEMRRMKLDITDIDVRTARNSRDIGIHCDPPKDARKPNGGRQFSFETIYDPEPSTDAADAGIVSSNEGACAYIGNRESDDMVQWQIPTIREAPNAQLKRLGSKGPIVKNPQPQKQRSGVTRVNIDKGHGGARSKVPTYGSTTETNNSKPQRSIVESLIRMARPAETKETSVPPVNVKNNNKSTGRATDTNHASTRQQGGVNDSWADDVSDEDLINSLNDADSTLEASTPMTNLQTAGGVSEGSQCSTGRVSAEAVDAEGATGGSNTGTGRVPATSAMTTGTTNLAAKKATNGAASNGTTATSGTSVNGTSTRGATSNGATSGGYRGNVNKAANNKGNRGSVQPTMHNLKQANYGKNNNKGMNKGRMGRSGQDSYADIAAKQPWETPKKRKRVQSVNKKVGSLSGARVFPQRDLYVQGIAFSWNDSYEDVEERMYLFGEERDLKFAFARAIPVKNDKTQIGCKITVNEADLDVLLDDDYWPENITVRCWHYGQRTDQQNGEGDGYDDGRPNY